MTKIELIQLLANVIHDLCSAPDEMLKKELESGKFRCRYFDPVEQKMKTVNLEF